MSRFLFNKIISQQPQGINLFLQQYQDTQKGETVFSLPPKSTSDKKVIIFLAPSLELLNERI